MNKELGLIFPTCDWDRKHFERFRNELTRLGLPFAVHLDHCCEDTKRFFNRHPLCVGFNADDSHKSYFDESYRQFALDILVEQGFKRVLHMDVDETLERDAPRKLKEVIDLDADVVVFDCLDMWGDDRHYRVDGGFGHATREKVFRLEGNKVKYPHPSSHAPNVVPNGKTRDDAKVIKYPMRILHWGIMNMEDARVHKDRWDKIYTRKLGGNPYQSYNYYFDPSVKVLVRELPEDV